MRALPLHLPIFAMALALGACGGDDAAEQAKGGAVSQNAVERELAEAPQMRPGLYRSRMEMVRFDVPGVPAEQQALMRGMMGAAQGMSVNHCLTEREAGRGPRDMFREMGQGDCTLQRFDVNGNALTGEMQCRGRANEVTTMRMTGTMDRESSAMTMVADIRNSGLPQGRAEMEMRVTSERSGDCTAAQEAEANRQADEARAALTERQGATPPRSDGK